MNAKAALRESGGTDYEKAYLLAAWRSEIQRAIDSVKRTKWDKWFRREWYRAGRHKRGNSSNRHKVGGSRRW